jgi:lactoylglutathione lyase
VSGPGRLDASSRSFGWLLANALGAAPEDRSRGGRHIELRIQSTAVGVRGLFETHLTVADLQRSIAFYRDTVGLPVALEVPERGAAFHWIGQPGQAMLGLWSLGSAPMGMQLHIAFDMTLDDVRAAPELLIAQGIQPLTFFGKPTSEPSVIGWMPAAAIYFRDPDGHMLEYIAMLDGPPKPELGIVPWSQRGDGNPPGPPRCG